MEEEIPVRLPQGVRPYPRGNFLTTKHAASLRAKFDHPVLDDRLTSRTRYTIHILPILSITPRSTGYKNATAIIYVEYNTCTYNAKHQHSTIVRVRKRSSNIHSNFAVQVHSHYTKVYTRIQKFVHGTGSTIDDWHMEQNELEKGL